MRKFVIDTNVLLSDPDTINYYLNKDNSMVVIPFVVVKELDNFKTRMDKTGYNARKTLKIIEEHMDAGGHLIVAEDLRRLEGETNDDLIVETAVALDIDGCKIILVSNDLNVRIKAKASKIGSTVHNKVNDEEKGYSGYTTIEVDDGVIDNIYNRDHVFLNEDEYPDLYINEYIVLQSSTNSKRKAVAKFINHKLPLRHVNVNDATAWDIKPRNYEQYFALDALLDPNVHVVSLIGIAGSGKTLLAVAAGIAQVFGKKGADKHYTKMLISRPIQPLGKDLGYLPGTIEEKLSPWIQPIKDNLEVITGGNIGMIEKWMDDGKIEVEALTYIRGRSISNCYIIIDEAQNLSAHEIKTILTRVGQGTKIILTGDVEQIDNAELNQYSNGLTYAVERLKEYDISAHVTFTKGERSRVAEIAAKAL